MGVFDRISELTGGDDEVESAGDDDVSPERADPTTMEPVDYRDRAEALAGRSNVPTLDFTVDSLEKLDGMVSGPTIPVEDSVALGSYLGEVLVRAYGGTWVADDGPAVAVDQGDDETTVAVFDAARMALEKGPVFQDVAARLEADGATRAESEPEQHREVDAGGAASTADEDATETVDASDAEPDDAVDTEVDEEPEADIVEEADEGPAEPKADAPVELEDDAAAATDEPEAETDLEGADGLDDAEIAESEGEGADPDHSLEADEQAADLVDDEAATEDAGEADVESVGDGDEAPDDGTEATEPAEEDDGAEPIEEGDPDGESVEEDDEDAGAAEDDDDDTADDGDDAADDVDPALNVTIDEIEMDEDLPGTAVDAPRKEDPDLAATSSADDGSAAGPDEEDPSPDEPVDDAATSTPADAASTEEAPGGADEDEDADSADDEGLGVAAEIADLAASTGEDAEQSPPEDDEPELDEADDTESESSAETIDADAGDEDASDATEDSFADVVGGEGDDDSADVDLAATDEQDAESEPDAGPSLDDPDTVVPAPDVTPSPDSETDAEPDAGTATDPAASDVEAPDVRDSDEPTDSVFEDLAAEVSGPDLPPRPELKRAAREFGETWPDREFDATPESLDGLDTFVTDQWAGRFREGDLADASPHPRDGLRPFARVGAYFGQTLVENLDGDWVPTENGEGAVEITGRGEAAEQIHVFDVARECLTRESTFAYRFDALANRFGVDAAAREIDDVFDVSDERADSTAVIPAILDRAEGFTDAHSAADLDYSPASLARLDELVAAEFSVTELSNAHVGEATDPDSLRLTERVTAAGAYYATVLVNQLDANWQIDGDVRLLVEGPEGSRTVDPVTVAVGAIRGDDSFAGHFERLADRVGRDPSPE